jgi:hypothetical protein
VPDVQVIENWVDVRGRLANIRPSAELQHHVSVTLDQVVVSPVAGFPNLFASTEGKMIEVNVPAAAGEHLERLRGTMVSWRIRKGGPSSNFVHPDLALRLSDR